MTTTMNLAATGAGSAFGLIEESAFGTTPATPSLQGIRCRPPSLNPEAENFINREINNNRMAKGHRRVFESGAISLPTQLVYGNTDQLLAAVLQGDWATGVPAVGSDRVANGSVNRAYSCEISRADASPPYFVQATGVLFNAFELSISADGNEPSMLNLSGLAKEITPSATTMDAGSGYTAAPANTPVLNGDWSFLIGGAAFEAIALTLNYRDKREAKRVIGSSTPTGFNRGAGGRSLTGTITGYAESKAHLDRWKNQTEASLTATATDAEGNALEIAIPTFKVGSINESDDAGPIRFEMPFEAYSATGATLLNITRTPV